MHRKAEKTLFITKYRITQDRTVIAGLVQAEQLSIDKNRRVLKRLVDITLFLANQDFPFWGHREYAGLGAQTVND